MRALRLLRGWAGWAAGLVFLLGPRSAAAQPPGPTSAAPSPARPIPLYGTVGLTVGAAGVGRDRRLWEYTDFHLGLRGDVLFGRRSGDSFAVGPYAEVLTFAFNQIQFGGGATVLFPVTEGFPLLLSAGAYGRVGDDRFGFEPGVVGTLFWGTRGLNLHGNYEMSAGLLAQMRYGLGASGETAIVLGAQLDLVAMSLPVIFLINAARGGSPATAPVR